MEDKVLKGLKGDSSFWLMLKQEFRKDRLATISLILLVVIFASLFIGSFLLDKEEIMRVDFKNKYAPPGKDFLLGADIGGRSIAGQLIIGGRNSLLIGFAITMITSSMGMLVGLTLGYYGGRLDSIIMRIVDFISIIPNILLVISFIVVVPNYNMWHFIFILSLFYWIGMARLVRAKTLSEREKDYVDASKIMGSNDFKIMFGGILPNIASIIIVELILSFAGNIGIETGLSFLGFGLPPGTPSLGSLVAYARTPTAMWGKLWLWLPASLLILIMMLSINYIGQTLKKVLNSS